MHVWVDKAAESVRIDFRNGIDKTYFIRVSRQPLPHSLAAVRLHAAAGFHSGTGVLRNHYDGPPTYVHVQYL